VKGKMFIYKKPPKLSMRNSMHVGRGGVVTSPGISHGINDQRLMLKQLISKNKKSLDRGFLVTQKSTDVDSRNEVVNS
jgi:hypothetical protein